MSTVDDALAHTVTGQLTDAPPSTTHAPGHLTVSDRAVRHLVHGVAQNSALRTRDIHVRIDRLDDHGLNAHIELAVEYPQTLLSDALREFRRHVARNVQQLLGRPLRRLDVVIADLVVGIEPTRRVQ